MTEYTPRTKAVPFISARVAVQPSGRTDHWLGLPLSEQWGYITSPFGPRTFRGMTFHYGIDLDDNLRQNQDVLCVAPGYVILDDDDPAGGEGVSVRVQHPYGLWTTYKHLVKGSQTVKLGQLVPKGHVLGKIGTTGNSTGTHLHFEVSDALRGDPDYITASTNNPVEYLGELDLSFTEVARSVGGSTLRRIGTVRGLDPFELAHFNGLRDPDHIRVGQKLFIPTESALADLREFMELEVPEPEPPQEKEYPPNVAAAVRELGLARTALEAAQHWIDEQYP